MLFLHEDIKFVL